MYFLLSDDTVLGRYLNLESAKNAAEIRHKHRTTQGLKLQTYTIAKVVCCLEPVTPSYAWREKDTK